MNDLDETGATTDFPQWVRDLPVLSGFQQRLQGLTEAGARDLDATFSRLGELIGASRSPLLIRIQLSDGDDVRTWLLDADFTGCRVTGAADRPPDVEAILDVETWTLLASGEMSPLEAFGRGRLQVRGSMRAARYLARLLYRTDTTRS
jgi:putative sterol carrier protein